MKILETQLEGAFILQPIRVEDDRGWFARTFDLDELAGRGLETAFVQHSTSSNALPGTLRGLHYQEEPFGEVKIVRCTAGAIHDVIVDLRPSSPTYLKHDAVKLSGENSLSLYIPRGCAHGFLTLAPASEVFYLISERYHPEAARGIRWNDPAFGIEWPLAPAMISERDACFPDWTR